VSLANRFFQFRSDFLASPLWLRCRRPSEHFCWSERRSSARILCRVYCYVCFSSSLVVILVQLFFIWSSSWKKNTSAATTSATLRTFPLERTGIFNPFLWRETSHTHEHTTRTTQHTTRQEHQHKRHDTRHDKNNTTNDHTEEGSLSCRCQIVPLNFVPIFFLHLYGQDVGCPSYISVGEDRNSQHGFHAENNFWCLG